MTSTGPAPATTTPDSPDLPDAPTTPGATGATAVVTGDGSTARGRAARRWRRARWTVLVLTALVLTVVLMALARPATSTVDYAPDNAGPGGARAVAEVLADHGVEVRHVTTVADALAAAGDGSTLLVTPAPFMLPQQATALAGTPADVVVAGGGSDLVRAVSRDSVARVEAPPPADPVEPGCDVPAAVAAGPLRLAGSLTAASETGRVDLCWPRADGAALAHVRVASDDARAHDVTLVDDASFLRNDTVLQEGNAALALGLLGAHADLVWLVQDPLDTSSGAADPAARAGTVLPGWAGVVGLWALLVAVVAAVWQARRLGPLVPERLPVVVRASESTRGRGRLYRRSRSAGHAAAGLRASTAERVARRLGLPRSADPTALTDAVARAAGRPPQQVADLLYGPPPADDAALTELARRLDTLESEVHRL